MGLGPDEHDPIPISVFLDHTEWFREQKRLAVEEVLVDSLEHAGERFEAVMSDGSTITAAKVLAAPGIAHFAQLPTWYAELPADRRTHTSERVTFDDLTGARVAIIGGRQSAYEWAALLCDHDAARVDVIHRHDTPTFEKVSWAFVDPYVEQTLQHRGWWRESCPRSAGRRSPWSSGRYLAGVLDRISVTDGFPDLSPGLETTLPGLFVTGFAATRDFGPFYRFTKGCPSAAHLAVSEMLG